MITCFKVQNYKALRDVNLELTPFHVLIGPNDSGKTSLMHAMMSLSRSLRDPLEKAFVGRWEGTELVWHGSSKASILLKAFFEEPEKLSYELVCSFSEQARQVRRESERFITDSNTLEAPKGLHSNATFASKARNAQDNQHAFMAGKVAAFLSGVEFYRWSASMLALPVAAASSLQTTMHQSGFGLAGALDAIFGVDMDKASQLLARFRTIFPQVRSIKLLPKPSYTMQGEAETASVTHGAPGKGIYFQFNKQGKLVPASQVADGILFVLAYLTILSSENPPRLLLIEEPENGVHPKLLTKVLMILRELIQEHPKTQVVLTTHSPYVLDQFKPEEVTICRREEDGSVSVHRMNESEEVKKQVDVFTLGEIWSGTGEDAIIASTVKSEAAQ